MSEDMLNEIWAEQQRTNELLNKLILLEQANIILREAVDLNGQPRTVDSLHKLLTDAYKASIDYSAAFDQVGINKIVSDLDKLL